VTESAQVETARPKRPDRNGQTEKSCSEFRIMQKVVQLLGTVQRTLWGTKCCCPTWPE